MGLDQERRRLDPAGIQAGRHGRRGGRRAGLLRVPLRRRQHRHRRRVRRQRGAGAAWVWTRSGGVWTQQGTKLVGTGAVGDADQGQSVSLSADGNTAIVGGWQTMVMLGRRGSSRRRDGEGARFGGHDAYLVPGSRDSLATAYRT